MIEASQNYWDTMASGIRPVGEIRIRWYIDDATTIVLTSDELSMNGSSVYETFFDPLMTELPYTRFNFTIIDEDGTYDPMGLVENPLQPKQKVNIIYRQYLDSDMSTFEDIQVDTLYTTGESDYSNKEFTVYCQDALSIAFTSEDVYVENDTTYTLGERTFTSSLGTYTRYFGERTAFEIVCDLLDELGVAYSDDRRRSYTPSDNLPIETYIEKEQRKVDLLQALLNANMWAIFMKNDIAHIVSGNYPTSGSDPEYYLTDYSITNDDIFTFPVIENMTQAKQMNVNYQVISYEKSLTNVEATMPVESYIDETSGDTMNILSGTFNGDATSAVLTARYNSQGLKSCFYTWQKSNAYDGKFHGMMDTTKQITTEEETFDIANLSVQTRPVSITNGVKTYPSTTERNGEIKKLDNRYVQDFQKSNAIAQYYYNYSVPKNHFSLTFRGEPCLELNDCITVQTEWENDVICKIDSISLSFNGALESTLKVSRIEVSQS